MSELSATAGAPEPQGLAAEVSGAAPGRGPLEVFRVGLLEVSDGADGPAASAQQQLCARFADHRGRIDLPVFGVLFDHLGGIPFYRTGADAGAESIQARLMMSALGDVGVDDRLTCDTQLQMQDEGSGVTGVRIRTQSGQDCCVGQARSMRVGRAASGPATEADLAADIPGIPGAHDVRLPNPIPSTLSGADIVAQIAAGERDRGPLVELLNGRVEFDRDDARVRLIVDTQEWMGNIFGTMHGGVIATIVGQACSLAGQAAAQAGRDYRVADLTVGFFRSPPVQGIPVVVDVEQIKVGRRIASVRARMTGHDGTLLADGSADIHFS